MSSNLAEFSQTSPLRPETITVPKVIELLGTCLVFQLLLIREGDKQKVTVIDSSDPKRCFNMLAKKFGEYWAEDERVPVVCHDLCTV